MKNALGYKFEKKKKDVSAEEQIQNANLNS
jgi:hypothetical protein